MLTPFQPLVLLSQGYEQSYSIQEEVVAVQEGGLVDVYAGLFELPVLVL